MIKIEVSPEELFEISSEAKREERERIVKVVEAVKAETARDVHDYEAAAVVRACSDILAAIAGKGRSNE